MSALHIPKSIWQEPSDREIDSQLKKFIADEWSEPPTALQVAKALHLAVFYALASGFVIGTFNVILEEALAHEQLNADAVKAEVDKWFLKEIINQ